MPKIKIGFSAFLGAIVLLLLFHAPIAYGSASLYFLPDSGSFAQNGNFRVSVMVRSDEAINAIRGFVNFPTQYLEVLSIDKSSSIVNFWVQNPSFSNAGDTGNVYFEGAILNPGYQGPGGKILDIIVRPRAIGSTELYFSNFSILANDGKGTNVSVPGGSADFTITQAEVHAVPPPITSNDLQKVEAKINTVQQKIDDLSVPKQGFSYWWSTLPHWVRLGASILIGVAAFVLSLLIFSFGLLVSVWALGYTWRRREIMFGFGRKIPRKASNSIKKAEALGKKIGEELGGDLEYAASQFKSDIKESSGEVAFSQLIEDYRDSLKRIIKRFTTWNGK